MKDEIVNYPRRRVLKSMPAVASIITISGCSVSSRFGNDNSRYIESSIYIRNFDTQSHRLNILVKNEFGDEILVDKSIEIPMFERRELTFDTANLEENMSTTIFVEAELSEITDDPVTFEESITSDESILLTIEEPGEIDMKIQS